MSKKQKKPTQIPEHIQTHRRGRAINRSASAVAGIFFIFVLVYLIRSLYAFVTTPHIATEVVKLGSIDQPRSVSGIIIRDENVYTAGREGRVSFSVSDYDRVKPGMAVCSIQNVEAVEDITRNVTSIEEQIIELQQMRKDISSVDPAVQRVNTQIKNIVDSRLQYFTTLTISELYALKESISQSVGIRNQMILDDNKNIREDLNLQQQQLISRLNTHVSVIKSEQSGIMSPMVDGLEDKLTFENMKELSREQTQMSVDYDKLIPTKDVKTDDPVFKIISSNEWYIAAYIPNDLIETYEEGDTRTLYLENKDEYVPIVMSVYQIDPGYRESFVLFKCTKNLIQYLNMRSVTIKTTDSIRKGLKISNSAITKRTFLKIPLNYVYGAEDAGHVVKQVEEEEVIVPVKIADRDEAYAYVVWEGSDLSMGDIITSTSPVASSYEITETTSIQGVYRVNNGFAEFRRITLDEDVSQTSGFSVLNPTLNQEIRVYDYIVTDASLVKDGQILH